MRLAASIALAGLLSACGQAGPPGPDMAVILAESPAPNLSDYGLFSDMVSAAPATRVASYSLVNPLFSDHAAKDRFVFVPEGEAADYHDTDVFTFPVGTVLVKTFRFAPDMRTPGVGAYRVETRLLIHKPDGWAAYPYVWNEAQTEAEYAPVGARRAIETIAPSGDALTVSYSVPNQNQCKTCHQAGHDIQPIGPRARHLNHHGQLQDWEAAGIIGPLPEHIPADPAVGDVSLPLETRARAWLDINCSHCHKPDGSASNSGLVLLSTESDPVKIGIGKRPVAAGRGSGDLLQVIVPGAPERSIMTFRMASTEPGVAMPELGRSVADPDGLALVRDWIVSMETE